MSWLMEAFKTTKPIIGMIHLPALPGTPLYDERSGIAAVVDNARRDLDALQAGGVDAVMFCNENDRPYELEVGPEIVAAMTRVIAEARSALSVPFGVDILWDPMAAVAVGHATGASFVREVFTGTYAGDMGLWSGQGAKYLRFRRNIGAGNLRLLFNIFPEFAAWLGDRPIEVVAKTTVFSSLADAVCVSGQTAGTEVSQETLEKAKGVLPDTPVFANTGVRIKNVEKILRVADGAIVGTSFKTEGVTWNHVDAERVKEFMTKVRDLRN
jgi:membrane complex biogenesis BtpA family protein